MPSMVPPDKGGMALDWLVRINGTLTDRPFAISKK